MAKEIILNNSIESDLETRRVEAGIKRFDVPQNDAEELPQKQKLGQKTPEEIKEHLFKGDKEGRTGSKPLRIKSRDIGEVRKEVARIDQKMAEKNEKGSEVKIDKKIRELVIGLRRWQVETQESCEGHRIPIGFKHQYPLVRFSKEDALIVERILKSYDNGDCWLFELSNTGDSLVLHPRLKEGHDGLFLTPRLSAYQKEVRRFAEWLQNLPDDYDFIATKTSRGDNFGL